LSAVRLFSLGPVDGAISTLSPLLDARRPGLVLLAALQTLGERDDPRVAAAIIDQWTSLSPAARREAAEVLLARAARITAFLDAVEAGTISASEIDPARKDQLLASRDSSIRVRAAALFGKTARADRAKVIADYRAALEKEGDRERGKVVFKQNCATCHKAEGEGTDVGPNLATITGRTAEDLLTHILDPNREVAPAYVNYTVALADGRIVSGIIAQESANALTLKRAEGVTEVIPRTQIEAITSTGISLMPENLETIVNPQGMSDLLLYLRGLKPEPSMPK
jgi:putative heme-binding domain-containing protein